MPWTAPTKHFPRHYTGSTVRDPDIRFHYTKGVHLPKIAQDGVLNPAFEGGLPDDRPRVLWASTHPVWEATVCIGVDPDPAGRYRTATFAETVAAVHGVYRVALTPESVPYDFLALADLTGMSARERQAWQSTARDKGANPADWWGTLSPVGRDEWLDVQRWDAARCDWVSVEIHAEVQRLIEAGLRLGLPSAAFQQELTAHYLGQQVIVGQTWDAMLADSHEGRYYILGTLDPEHPTLPDHVLAIIADDQHEAVDEYLSLWTVEEKGSIVTATPHPLIVLDTQERCVYGLELLQAILDTGKTVPAVIIRGVVLPER